MDRDALGPVALVVLAVILLTSVVTATLDRIPEIPVVYTEAASNGGMAIVLVAVLVLFEWLSYEAYREKGLLWMLADAALVFVAGAVVTVVAIAGFEAAGLGDAGGEVGAVVVDVSALVSGLAAFLVAVYVFYARNRDVFQSPRARARREK